MNNNYESYADVLESYMIAEEGILSKVAEAGSFVVKKLKAAIEALIKLVKGLISKLKRSGTKMSKKELLAKLQETERTR